MQSALSVFNHDHLFYTEKRMVVGWEQDANYAWSNIQVSHTWKLRGYDAASYMHPQDYAIWDIVCIEI